MPKKPKRLAFREHAGAVVPVEVVERRIYLVRGQIELTLKQPYLRIVRTARNRQTQIARTWEPERSSGREVALATERHPLRSLW